MHRFIIASRCVLLPFSLCGLLLLSGSGCACFKASRGSDEKSGGAPAAKERMSSSKAVREPSPCAGRLSAAVKAGAKTVRDGVTKTGSVLANAGRSGVKSVRSGAAKSGSAVANVSRTSAQKVGSGVAKGASFVAGSSKSSAKKAAGGVAAGGRAVADASAAGAKKSGSFLADAGKAGAKAVREGAVSGGSRVAGSDLAKGTRSRMSTFRSFMNRTRRGYLRNVRDDLMDCGSLAVGVVPPLVRSPNSSHVIGIASPAFGAYLQLTDFGHLGALYKATGDLEWDRRGAGVMVDIRKKIGLGPLNRVYITQRPVKANAYKVPGSEMDPWRRHMDLMRDPLFFCAAKTMIFEPEDTTFYLTVGDKSSRYEWIKTMAALPRLPFGWQDWEFLSLELAFPEPFFTHSGFYLRVGVDPSQVFDLLLSTVGYDFYDDAAYTSDGELEHTE